MLKSNLIRSNEFGTAVARRLKRALVHVLSITCGYDDKFLFLSSNLDIFRRNSTPAKFSYGIRQSERGRTEVSKKVNKWRVL